MVLLGLKNLLKASRVAKSIEGAYRWLLAIVLVAAIYRFCWIGMCSLPPAQGSSNSSSNILQMPPILSNAVRSSTRATGSMLDPNQMQASRNGNLQDV